MAAPPLRMGAKALRIVVTGAGGFVGGHVLKELTEHEIVALDTNLGHITEASNITKIEGDLRDPATLRDIFKQGCDAVIHLATVPGGAAEINPDLAKSVNIDATMALIDMAAKTGACPRFVFASSIAVFGKLPPAPVIDDAPVQPTMLYGAQKLMMENWIATQSRRGAIEGLSLRLPGIVARPRSPSGMKSAFLSNLFHTLRNGEDFTIPVSQDATTWLCSVQTAAKNLSIAVTRDDAFDIENGPILPPTQRVNILDLEEEIRRQLGSSSSIVRHSPDEKLQSIFGVHPEIETPQARSLGFVKDTDLAALVKAAL